MGDLLDAGFTVITTAPPVNAIDQATAGRTTLNIEEDADFAGRMFAAEVDLALTTWAFGIEAVLNHLRSSSETAPSPLVLIGVSSGAVAVPIVAARLHQKFPIQAAVLIAGGADAAAILLGTTLAPEDLRLNLEGGRFGQLKADAFAASYHRAVRLDAAPITEWLGQRPVLLLEAGFDAGGPLRALRPPPGRRRRDRGLDPTLARPDPRIFERGLRSRNPPCRQRRKIQCGNIVKSPRRVVG